MTKVGLAAQGIFKTGLCVFLILMSDFHASGVIKSQNAVTLTRKVLELIVEAL